MIYLLFSLIWLLVCVSIWVICLRCMLALVVSCLVVLLILLVYWFELVWVGDLCLVGNVLVFGLLFC